MIKAKNILVIILMGIFIFTSCGKKVESTTTTAAVMDAVNIVIAEKELADSVVYREEGSFYSSASTVEGEYLNEGQISMFYGNLTGAPDFSIIDSYDVWISNGTVTTEIGIFKVKSEENVQTVIDFLNERVLALQANSHNYAPEEEKKASNAVVSSKDKYVYYIITNINSPIEEAIISAIESGYPKN